MHVCRGPVEPADGDVQALYERLLACLQHPAVRDGAWQLLECVPAWEGNSTADGFIAFAWRDERGQCLLVAVNYAPNQGQCYMQWPPRAQERVQSGDEEGRGTVWQLKDVMGEATYRREASDLASRGLYLDLPAWGYHVFELTAT